MTTGYPADRKRDRTGWLPAVEAFPTAIRRWLCSSNKYDSLACSRTCASPAATIPAEGRAPCPGAGRRRRRRPEKADGVTFDKEEGPEASMAPHCHPPTMPSSAESTLLEDSFPARPAGRRWVSLAHPHPFRLKCRNSELEGCKY